MLFDEFKSQLPDVDPTETREWLEALEDLVAGEGPERARRVLWDLLQRARQLNIDLPALTQTPYINTIPPQYEDELPGDAVMEKRIRRIIRWNAMAMVQRANVRHPGLGGHIATYASSASLYEIGFNHFFRGRDAEGGGDQVFMQGHGAPGIYARAFLEGRLSEEQLDNFRRETGGKGLSSYPHPYLMPDFWEFPTVSMGLGPLAAIYQARFNRYLHNRGIKDTSQQRVWGFVGDGEMDESEALGGLSLASREGLDNLIFVVNCNLQRLDGPVRGNGKVIQELERTYRGAGWHVIKVVWGPEWDELLAADVDGKLVQRMNDTVDGEYQKLAVGGGAAIREKFFGADADLLKLVERFSDEQLFRLRRGGHSFRKLYTAYKAAVTHQNAPAVILAHTVKGWTLGSGAEAANIAHQVKNLDVEQLKKFRDTIHLPIPDSQVSEMPPYYHPGPKSPEVEYMLERRRALGGVLPRRKNRPSGMKAPGDDVWGEFAEGSKAGVEASSTMAFVRLLRKLLRDKVIGKNIVPIIPDEARTFGMESLFREIGIYAPLGQLYEPVDSHLFLNYHESKEGQLLEEGITEAGSMASFSAAGTCYATHGITTIPFYIFYSMFGLQRTGDQAWALGDMRARGFLLGATAGRTTLNGEGLQHEDGHSHLIANVYPTMRAYDPAYAYEIAVIIRDGLRRMLEKNEDALYYITLYNEKYLMPAMPPGAEDGILRGMYVCSPAPAGKKLRAQLFGSGTLLPAALEAQKLLADQYDVGADVWSITSYQQLFRDGRAVERWNRLHPGETPRVPYIAQALTGHDGPVVTSSDWVSELPSLVSRFVPRRFVPLGANGFGRSDTREALRRFFEIDAASMVVATLSALCSEGKVQASVVKEAMRAFEINSETQDPFER